MALAPGSRLGLYEIVAPLGAGGMGEVYRARDPRLNRDVAIKVLPDAFAADAERVARFDREAQLLAALNHPRIAAIYGIEERAIILELIDGLTLADRISSGRLRVEEAVPIAIQIAEALEAAHEKGVVHRDLKPANIKLTPDGDVKVLDFGLAKLLDTQTADVTSSQSPTFPAGATFAGVILGTAPYMSPEQARGRAVDKRADIWAFGCVLFEMLSGTRAFAGEDVSETLGAIIHKEPPWNAVPADVPAHIQTLLRRCLEKNPKERLRDIGEARITLARPLNVAAVPNARASGTRRAAAALIVVAAAGMAAAVTAWVLGERAGRPVAPERRFTLAAPGGAPPAAAAISPDGGAILVIAAGKLWVQRLDSFAAIEVPGSEDARVPFWSPDGAAFGFEARGQLWRVARDGGAPVRIGAVPEFGFSSSVAWLRDGRLLFTTGGSGLLQIPVTGGEPTTVFALDTTKELDIHDVSAIAGGEMVLYVVHTASGPWTIELLNASDAARRTVFTAAGATTIGSPVYSSTGHLLFERQGGVWAAPFSLHDQRLTGAPSLVLSEARLPAAAGDGTLVMLPGGTEADAGLGWVDRAGNVLRTIAEPRGTLGDPRLSPDGRSAVAVRGSRTESDLWIYDLERGSERRLTFEGGPDSAPAWSPDGQHIVYRCDRTICARRADGAGPRVELLEGPATNPAVSPDGRLLAFVKEVQPGDTEIFVVELGGSGFGGKIAAQPRLLVSAPRLQMAPQISPDGRFVAYTSIETGRMTTYVTPFPSGDGKWEVPLSGANLNPRWNRKSDGLSVMDERGRIVEFPIDRSRGFDIAAPLTRFPSRSVYGAGYDRSADGAQFLVPVVSAASADAGRLLVVQNWRPAMP